MSPQLATLYIALKIVYSIDALQALIEEEKQEALTQLGEHYQHQLQSLQEHISDLQRRLSDANKLVIAAQSIDFCQAICDAILFDFKSSLKEEELAKLRDIIAEQEQQLEQLGNQQEQEKSNNEIKACRRRHSDDSTTAESSSGGEDEASTPPVG